MTSVVDTTPAAAAARGIAAVFFDRLQNGDVDGAFETVSDEARVVLHPLSVRGTAQSAKEFWTDAIRAFPDLILRITRTSAYDDGRALVELTFEGTQADTFVGAINQEKHLDIEQAWLLETDAGRITGISAYWDQNKLYRRLAVKRLDQISIA